jgi:hypothetical protein
MRWLLNVFLLKLFYISKLAILKFRHQPLNGLFYMKIWREERKCECVRVPDFSPYFLAVA